MSLRVSPMRDEDAPAVSRAWARAFGHGPDPDELRAQRRRPVARVFVARLSGEEDPVGFAVAQVVADECELHLVASELEHRRAGVGRALLAAVVDAAKEAGALEVHLEVRRGNDAARAFYRALCFDEVGVRARYYADGEDAILMTLRLSATP